MDMISIRLQIPINLTVKQNRMTVLHKLLHKAVRRGVVSKKHQVSAEHESVLDLDTNKTYVLEYERATYGNHFILINEDDDEGKKE